MNVPAPGAPPELLEREDELHRLAALVGDALAGDGSIAALEGEAGIGKSALLSYARRRARETGMRVLSARGGELERDFGYGVVRQLFDAPLAAMKPAEREPVFNGAATFAAAALGLPGASGAPPSEPGAVLHGLYWLTANLAAERPLLIAIDDAHWADGASLAFLSYLARRLEGLPVLVVYATRHAEGSSERLPATAEPELVGAILRPAVLGEDATVKLLDGLLGSSSAEFAHACRVATAGNPFLLQELARALRADGITPDKQSCERVAQIAPGTVSRAILARLARLGGPATQLAFAIAVLGRSAELRHAAALADLSLAAAADAADALTAAAILHDGRPLEFIHPVVRTTVYAEIPSGRRAASHRRAAALLERDGVPAAELAAHLLATEPAADRDVVRGLRAAAREVRARGANEAACVYLDRALAEPPPAEDRADVEYELGSAQLAAGESTAINRLRAAIQGALSKSVQVAAAVDYVAALVLNGRLEEGLELFDAAIVRLAGGDAEAALQLEGLSLAIAQLDPATSGSVRERLQRFEGRLRGESFGERLLLASMAYDAVHRRGPAAHASELAELALADPQELLQFPEAANFPLAAWTLFCTDDLERSDELYTLMIDNARARGSLFSFAIATGLRSHVLLRQGRLDEAEAEARSTMEAGPTWAIGRTMILACVLDVLAEQADGDSCRAFLAEHGIEEDLAGHSMATRLLFSRGHVRLATGDPAGALRDFEQIRERELRGNVESAAVPTRASEALARAQLGDHERALELARDELERARVWGTPSALSFALRACGIVTGGDDGIELLREAAAVVEDSPARYERARSLTEYGAALRRAGRRRDAREPLRAALELADRCGALRTAKRAREELLATGARPRRTALSGADSLTPSERRVCALAAGGMSNREVAQALFVTVRTVEGHLTQAYSKLDVTRREQLVAALAPAG